MKPDSYEPLEWYDLKLLILPKFLYLIFLTINFSSSVFASPENLAKAQPHQQKRISPRSCDLNQIENFLNQHLEQSPDLISPLTIIAKNLKVDKKFISRYFRDLCQKIVAKRLSYKKDCYLDSLKQCCNEVEQVTKMLFKQGEYPTED
ncbi:hypothetical protein [Gloeothece verrucosa]|uniref:Uncharacterized protein n=1 Tax=Gloeothece verrucosa (strain PCC 7822) TaxID=497965 RepID=E0UMR7_GLOV7|nr:hypothetical protein [Gloeothece verrucosa]ADN18247.1 hypothetical protein Cyan7822_6468 [Gloeothece verrucosa PCC 7822]